MNWRQKVRRRESQFELRLPLSPGKLFKSKNIPYA